MPPIHRTYDKDFRQEAVNLLLSSGRPLKRVAAELGVTPNSLRTWRDRAFGKGRVAQAASAEPKGRSEAPFADPAGERKQAAPARYRILRPEDEMEVERLYQRLKTVGNLDQKNSTDEK